MKKQGVKSALDELSPRVSGSMPGACCQRGWAEGPDGRPPECNKKGAVQMDSTLKKQGVKSALGELGSTTGGLQTVLRSFLSRFSLVFRAFPDFSLFSYPMW